MKRGLRNRLFAWWYFCIAAGFLLLAANRWMLGEQLWLIWLRVAIAAGFTLLGVITIRSQAG